MIEFENARLGEPVKNAQPVMHKRSRKTSLDTEWTDVNLNNSATSNGYFDSSGSSDGGQSRADFNDGHEHAIDTQETKAGLNVWRLAALTFFTVSGGPYGLEPLVAQCGPLWAIIGLLLVPWIWGLPSALMTAELGSTLPEMGGYIVWVQRSLGDFWAFQNAFWNIFTNCLDNSLYPVMFVDYLEEVIGYAFSYEARTAIGVSMVLALSAVNIVGVDVVGDGAGLFGLIVIAPFVLLVTWGFTSGNVDVEDWGRTTEDKNWGFYVSMLLWNTCGYDSAGTCAAEVDNPGKTFPRAMLITIVLTTLMYVLPVMVGVSYATDWAEWEDGHFVLIGMLVGGNWLKYFVLIAANISSLGQLNSTICTSSRALACISGFGYVPRTLAHINPKYGTPVKAILFNCLSIILMVVSGLDFEHIAQISMWLYALTLIFEFISLIVLRHTEPDLPRPYKVPGGMLGVYFISIPPCLCGIALMLLSEARTWLLCGGIIVFTLLITPVFYKTSGKPANLPAPLAYLLRCLRCYTFKPLDSKDKRKTSKKNNGARVMDSHNSDSELSMGGGTSDSEGVELSSMEITPNKKNEWTDNSEVVFGLHRTENTDNVPLEEIDPGNRRQHNLTNNATPVALHEHDAIRFP